MVERAGRERRPPERMSVAPAVHHVALALALALLAGTACTKSSLSPLTACPVNPDTLSFGNVTVESCSVVLAFTIRNNSAGTLSGFVEENCPDFAITLGAGAYRLGPGRGILVKVRFCPQSVGPKTCTIETGSGVCGDVTLIGTADPPAQCQVSTAALSFANTTLGSCTATQSFTITNPGPVLLSGTVSESCPDFEITSGGGAYSLSQGQIRTVDVRFCPQGIGAKSCTIETGNSVCNDVALSGTGDPSPDCQVSPLGLSFGNATVGGCTPTQSFTITNTGSGTLSGTVAETCLDFEITSGGGAYNLAPTQARVVTVRFCPQSVGPKSCAIETGNAVCSDVTVSGTGDASVACQVGPSSMDFGNVFASSCSDVQTFFITNTGFATLTGIVSEACPDFQIEAGEGPYNLAPSQSHAVTVRFCPTSEGPKSCTIETGSPDCGAVAVSGTGMVPSDCHVEPTFLSFGTWPIGGCNPATQTFTITNVGSGQLSGTVNETCGDIVITDGGGPYTLGPGHSRTVTVQFCPVKLAASGERRVIRIVNGPESPQGACVISTGTGCPDVLADGDGVLK